MLILIAEVIIVILSSWLLTKRYFDRSLFSELILVWFILFFAQIVLVELILGIIGRLYYFNVFMAHLLIFAISVLFCFKKIKPEFLKPDIEPFIKSNLLLFAFSIFSAFFIVKSFSNLVNPVLSPDSLQYHLVFPAAWITNGNLNNPFFVFGASPIVNPGSLETGSLSYYPINAQLFFTWLMLPLRNAFLADLGEAPFYIIGIITVYAILKRYGVNRTLALLSGFLWVLIPNIFKQLRTASQIDIICSVLFLLVFYTVLLLKQDFRFRNALLFGISVGFLVGTKIINFVWLVAFLPFSCYLLFKGAKESKCTMSRGLSFLGIITSMIILFGGFMYIKNYLFTGNPLFPVSLKVFGKTIFNGLLDNTGYKIQIASGDNFNLMKILFKEGLGVQFLALILPCTFLPIFFYRRLKTKVQPFGEYLLLFVTPLLMLILYCFFISIYSMRYFFPYFSLGLLTAVIFITKFPRLDKYIIFISFVSISAAAFELAKGYELVLSILLSFLFFGALVFYKKQIVGFYRSKTFAKAMLAGLLTGVLLLVYFNNKYDKEEFDRYPLSFSKKEAWQRDIGKGWKALNDITKDGARVAYTGRSEFYPLFGTRFKNIVKYVSINEKEITPYNKPDGLCRRTRDFSSWRENLKKEEIEYLFVALPFFVNRETEDLAKFPIEDEWAVAHPENFKLLYSNSLARIYKVLVK